MSEYRFNVNGPLHSFRKSTIPIGRGIRVNDRDYRDFKNKVLVLAMEKGFRKRGTTKLTPAKLSVCIFWKDGARKDWANVYKAVEDALFFQDRYVIPGSQNSVFFGSPTECAEVVVEDHHQ